MDVLIETVDLAEIIEDVAITAEGLLLNKSVELREDVASDLPPIQSDYTKIKQMLNNLIGNAIKFTTEGYVAIRAKWLEDQGVIRVEVEDSGPGISPEKISTVFESFKQADSSISKKFGGTGLGLTITKQFCEMLGIVIGIESEVGRGTTFWLHIPAKTAESAATPEHADPLPRDVETGGAQKTDEPQSRTVLIVDDDDINLQVTSEILRLSGYELLQASSAEEGIRLAHQKQPNMIIMDLAMPGMDGVEASKILKSSPDTADIPILACTAHVTQETRARALQAGCDAFLTRPIEPHKLLRHIALLLEKQPTDATV
ncbi:multi-sensor hybrid histidine kinase [Candidatus Moduliflexus flocculans]|uniref:histidine kinase n=1 Tax=Candidatus Moduliflexus flocculans TaxID=1499966 RepID=A0A081BQE6_9BACT|nr:multi-sensor hybrid histidine kinase [Candidatus Moduliflexus flocculans]